MVEGCHQETRVVLGIVYVFGIGGTGNEGLGLRERLMRGYVRCFVPRVLGCQASAL